jgi:hypothetical protein
MESVRRQSDNEEIIKTNQTFSNALLHSQTQIHVYHLQTKSYSKHKALENFYKKIDNLADTYIETFQGKYKILDSYRGIDIDNNPDNCIEYLKGLERINNKTKLGHLDSDLNNIKDTINELINRTIYKLTYLE